MDIDPFTFVRHSEPKRKPEGTKHPSGLPSVAALHMRSVKFAALTCWPSPIRTLPSALAWHQICLLACGLGTSCSPRSHTADRELTDYPTGLTLPRRLVFFCIRGRL